MNKKQTKDDVPIAEKETRLQKIMSFQNQKVDQTINQILCGVVCHVMLENMQEHRKKRGWK